ncbi:hypothetical protein BGX20_003201 [Mortierella sp. AD010]|nr:hypothetical protein BGX20_003201 [Mortierella sp. AD010]
MKFFATAIALVAAAVVKACEGQPDQPTMTSISSNPDFNITSITFNRYPFCIGESICATINGTLSAPITAPTHGLIIGFINGGSPFYLQPFDLCSIVSCPVAQNTTTLEFCFPTLTATDIPTDFSFNHTIMSGNGNGNELFSQIGLVNFTSCSS